jgi:hypothetical protein
MEVRDFKRPESGPFRFFPECSDDRKSALIFTFAHLTLLIK